MAKVENQLAVVTRDVGPRAWGRASKHQGMIFPRLWNNMVICQGYTSKRNSNGNAGRNGKAMLALFLVLEPMVHSLNIGYTSSWNSLLPDSHMAHSLTTLISVIKCGPWDPSITLSETAPLSPAFALSPTLVCLSFMAFSTTWHFKCHFITLLLWYLIYLWSNLSFIYPCIYNCMFLCSVCLSTLTCKLYKKRNFVFSEAPQTATIEPGMQ